MKLVAIRNFANVKALGIDAKKCDCNHDGQIDKGARFSIGKSEVFKQLTNTEQQHVAQLIVSKSAVVDNSENAELIKVIDAEVAAEKAAAKSATKEQSLEEKIATAVAIAVTNLKGKKDPATA